MKPELRELFIKIHNEYDAQAPTLRGETDYSEKLLELQQRLLEGNELLEVIKEEFENLFDRV